MMYNVNFFMPVARCRRRSRDSGGGGEDLLGRGEVRGGREVVR